VSARLSHLVLSTRWVVLLTAFELNPEGRGMVRLKADMSATGVRTTTSTKRLETILRYTHPRRVAWMVAAIKAG
jgi:hypothetical protein